MNVLITGVAGFLGFHLAARLLRDGATVTGLDNLSDYYDVRLKRGRLAVLERDYGFKPEICDIADRDTVFDVFKAAEAEVVIHLAAQAGVRYSLDHPESYVASNLVGFANILEACRHHKPRHLLYASSSSVYGGNRDLPFRESDKTDKPVSFYAATKRANEAMAYSYSHLYRIPMTGLRFFTAYGEWGRPDMAYFHFAQSLMAGRTIEVFNDGKMARDFTYCGDVAEAVTRLIPLAPDDEEAPHRIVNIAGGEKVALLDFIAALEAALGVKAKLKFAGMQAGDVVETWADATLLRELTGYTPATGVKEGLERFARWFKTWTAHD